MTEEERRFLDTEIGELRGVAKVLSLQLRSELVRSANLIEALEKCEDIVCSGGMDRDEQVRDVARAAIAEYEADQ